MRQLRLDWAPDVVHCHGARSFLAVRLRSGRPRVDAPWVTLHLIPVVSSDPPGYRLVRTAGLSAVPLLAAAAFSALPDAPRGWIFAPHSSYQLRDLEPMGPPTAPTPTFLWLGRLEEPKRPDLFVRAVAALAARRPEVRGIVAGSGPLETAMRALAVDLGAPIEFLGHVGDPSPFVRLAWAVVLLSEREAVTFAVQEAMWCERAVVTSPLAGLTWLVDDERALADDVAATHAALDRLCDESVARSEGQRNADRIRDVLGPDEPWSRVLQSYEDVLARRSRPA